jgi:hypothetical protein
MLMRRWLRVINRTRPLVLRADDETNERVGSGFEEAQTNAAKKIYKRNSLIFEGNMVEEMGLGKNLSFGWV